MNVLVLGSGGREHAIAWKIKQSRMCGGLYCMPGNPGSAQVAVNLQGNPSDIEDVRRAAVENDIDIVVVGPEEPLVKGLRDKFMADPQLKERLFVGPSAQGASLEGSKDFAKAFMQRHSIPTAAYRSFTKKDIAAADEYLESLQPPYVLKADGLAAGKGVLIIEELAQARMQLREMLDGKFGSAGNKVVIEQFLKGVEVSVFILTDGSDYLILPEAKDYKRIGEGDTGPNTGGMGAVSPVPFATPEFMSRVEERIIRPTIRGLKEEGIDYKGFIFLGLMNCNGDPYVIEYNVRMGDPETEAVMTRIDSDLLSHLVSCAKGTLKDETIEISKSDALTVVCVSEGYPASYKKGIEIYGEELLYENTFSGPVKIFHAGTKNVCDDKGNTRLVTNGGRVLAVTANCTLPSEAAEEILSEGRSLAYSQIEKILYDGKYFRGDIGLDMIEYIKEG